MTRVCIVAFSFFMLITSTVLAIPPKVVAMQPFEGCPGKGVNPPIESYFPDLSNGFVIISDERRNAEQLAATFADPADAFSRLRAWCWLEQVERVYARGWLTIDVSIHEFSGIEGIDLAMRWFIQQRSTDPGLQREGSRSALQLSDLSQTIVPAALANASEYTLYFSRGDLLFRVTVSGERPATEADRDVVAYQVMDLMLAPRP